MLNTSRHERGAAWAWLARIQATSLGRTRELFHLIRERFRAVAATTLAPVGVVASVRWLIDSPRPTRRPSRSSGSHAQIAPKTSSPIAEKANSGPGRPIKGRTNKGASAGPMIVPRPNEEDSAESAAT